MAGSAKPEAAALFFQGLVGRDEPLLQHLSGTVRFDLRHDDGVDRWFVAVDHGDVEISHRNAKADCVARMDADLFDALTRGEVNAISAAFRGDIEIEGQPAMLLAFQRLFPGPSAATVAGRADRSGSSR
jgi:putative sterol carrier protein